MEVVILERWEIVIMKINRKKNSYKKNSYEIVKLENETIIFELSCKNDILNFLQRTPYKTSS